MGNFSGPIGAEVFQTLDPFVATADPESPDPFGDDALTAQLYTAAASQPLWDLDVDLPSEASTLYGSISEGGPVCAFGGGAVGFHRSHPSGLSGRCPVPPRRLGLRCDGELPIPHPTGAADPGRCRCGHSGPIGSSVSGIGGGAGRISRFPRIPIHPRPAGGSAPRSLPRGGGVDGGRTPPIRHTGPTSGAPITTAFPPPRPPPPAPRPPAPLRFRPTPIPVPDGKFEESSGGFQIFRFGVTDPIPDERTDLALARRYQLQELGIADAETLTDAELELRLRRAAEPPPEPTVPRGGFPAGRSPGPGGAGIGPPPRRTGLKSLLHQPHAPPPTQFRASTIPVLLLLLLLIAAPFAVLGSELTIPFLAAEVPPPPAELRADGHPYPEGRWRSLALPLPDLSALAGLWPSAAPLRSLRFFGDFTFGVYGPVPLPPAETPSEIRWFRPAELRLHHSLWTAAPPPPAAEPFGAAAAAHRTPPGLVFGEFGGHWLLGLHAALLASAPAVAAGAVLGFSAAAVLLVVLYGGGRQWAHRRPLPLRWLEAVHDDGTDEPDLPLLAERLGWDDNGLRDGPGWPPDRRSGFGRAAQSPASGRP